MTTTTSSSSTTRRTPKKRRKTRTATGRSISRDKSSYDYYDNLHQFLRDSNYQYSQRHGIVETVAGSQIHLLPITTILRLSYTNLDEDTASKILETYGSSNYKGLAGFLLGMHHFNNGDGNVVKELRRINETCPVRLVTDVYDSEYDQVTALSIFTRLMEQQQQQEEQGQSSSSIDSSRSGGGSGSSSAGEDCDCSCSGSSSTTNGGGGGKQRRQLHHQQQEQPLAEEETRRRPRIASTAEQVSTRRTDTQTGRRVESTRKTTKRRPISVLFGASASSTTVPLSVLTSIHEIPQFSPSSTSTELDDKHQYRYFGRLIPSDAGTAHAALSFFDHRLKARHIGVLYVNDVYGTSYFKSLKELARTWQPHPISIRGYSFSPSLSSDLSSEIRHELFQLKSTGYKAFLGIFFDRHYEVVMDEAVKMGLAGVGYTWIFADGINESRLRHQSWDKGSSLAIATRGIGILKPIGGYETSTKSTVYDKFLESWRHPTSEAVSYYNSKNPTNNTLDNAEELYYRGTVEGFRNDTLYPSSTAIFAYDTAVALGLASCRAIEERSTRRRLQNGTTDDGSISLGFTGPELFDAMLLSDFIGASGQIALDPTTYSRKYETASFVLHNAYIAHDKGDTVVFDTRPAVFTSYDRTNGNLVWQDGPDGVQFLHSDGTPNVPDLAPVSDNEERNQLHFIRPFGLTLCAVLLCCSLGFALWTYINRYRRVVRASQPIFLGTICVGCFVMASSIIPLSIDDSWSSNDADSGDGDGEVNRVASVACMAGPWLFTLGFTTVFSALFSKIWRVNRIFHSPQFKRVKVTEWDVLIPFILLFTLNVLFLLIWTVVDPLVFQRMYIGETDAFDRQWNSIGSCRSTHDGKVAVIMAVLVFTVNIVALVLANVQAYRARTIMTEYSESKWIGIAMGCILEALLFGVPILFLVKDNPPADYFVKSSVIFAVALSVLFLVFIPKMVILRTALKSERRLRVQNAAIFASRRALEDVGRQGQFTNSSDSDGARVGNAAGVSTNSGKKSSSDAGGGSTGTTNLRALRRPNLKVMESFGVNGLRIISHPKVECEEKRKLKMELAKYMLATEKLAKSLEESGVDAQSCVEDLAISLSSPSELPDFSADDQECREYFVSPASLCADDDEPGGDVGRRAAIPEGARPRPGKEGERI